VKVVHINTFQGGGAGIAAYNLHIGLLENGIDSHFIVLYSSDFPGINVKKITAPKSTLFEKALNFFGLPQTQQQINYKIVKNKTSIGAPFTFPSTDIDITLDCLIQDADIINFHWISDFVDWKTFFKKNKIPLVWTLHDMNPFMGGFHYSIDLITNKNVLLKKYENEIYSEKEKCLHNISDIDIVCPSKWLMYKSQKSDLLSNFKHHHIFNSLDLDIFKILDKDNLRKKYNISNDKIVFVFVSEDVKIFRKGFDIVLQIIKYMSINDNVLFCAIGENKESSEYTNVKYFGQINNPLNLSEIYSLSDALLLPSREDNLPNVMLEAFACGTPVISFKTGGMIDVIEDYFNGLLANEANDKELLETIYKFIDYRHLFNRKLIRTFCEYHFSHSVQANSYIELYKQKISSN
jgi:glycosyltransferase involved in cell wall biosynthesis